VIGVLASHSVSIGPELTRPPRRAHEAERQGWSVVEESGQRKKSSLEAVDPAEFQGLLEQMEHANNAIEQLVNRTNTLVHLLDVLNKRVDRLESRS
jgi:chromosome segregation ATPase